MSVASPFACTILACRVNLLVVQRPDNLTSFHFRYGARLIRAAPTLPRSPTTLFVQTALSPSTLPTYDLHSSLQRANPLIYIKNRGEGAISLLGNYPSNGPWYSPMYSPVNSGRLASGTRETRHGDGSGKPGDVEYLTIVPDCGFEVPNAAVVNQLPSQSFIQSRCVARHLLLPTGTGCCGYSP